MASIKIDRELCTQCGLCVQDCVRRVFRQQADGEITVESDDLCLLCGHCVAVCPTDAINHVALGQEGFDEITKAMHLGANEVRNLLRGRRSVRVYRDKPVPRPVIEELIEVARFAPTASNRQNVAFTVIDDSSILRQLADLTIASQERLCQQLSDPSAVEVLSRTMGAEMVEMMVSNLPRLRRLVENYRAGDDVILWNAPAVLVTHSETGDYFGRDNCLFATYNIMIAATTRGLGTCLLGYLLRSIQQDGATAKIIGLPPDQVAHAAFTLGYPSYSYRRLVPRNQVPTRWI